MLSTVQTENIKEGKGNVYRVKMRRRDCGSRERLEPTTNQNRAKKM